MTIDDGSQSRSINREGERMRSCPLCVLIVCYTKVNMTHFCMCVCVCTQNHIKHWLLQKPYIQGAKKNTIQGHREMDCVLIVFCVYTMIIDQPNNTLFHLYTIVCVCVVQESSGLIVITIIIKISLQNFMLWYWWWWNSIVASFTLLHPPRPDVYRDRVRYMIYVQSHTHTHK